MTTRWLPRSASFRTVEERLVGMTDGIDEVVAFEVFDHPEAKVASHGEARGQVTGPWLLGPENECRAELEQAGFLEFEIKASAGMGRARWESER